MSGINVGAVLRLLWPPRPSRIVAKLAFLPPDSTYSIQSGKLILKEEADWDFSIEQRMKIEAFMRETVKHIQIAMIYMTAPKPTPSTYTVLYSHGNAVDVGQMATFLQTICDAFNVNVLCYDYSGYGESGGQPLESNMYADAEAAFTELRERYKCPLERIVLYGQSIGTAPTVELARRYKTAGVVLHSPLLSGIRLVFPATTRTHMFDPFTNIDKIGNVESPTLIIHGTEDAVIDVSHGRKLHSLLTHPLDPLWVDGAGHNDIVGFPQYFERLEKFFREDLHGPDKQSAQI